VREKSRENAGGYKAEQVQSVAKVWGTLLTYDSRREREREGPGLQRGKRGRGGLAAVDARFMS